MAKIMKYQIHIPSNIPQFQGLYIYIYLISHDAGFLTSIVLIIYRFCNGFFAGRFGAVGRERRGATWYHAPNVSQEGVVFKLGVDVPKAMV